MGIRISKVIGFLLCGVQAVATVVFLYALFRLNMLPMKYMSIIVVALVLILGVCFVGTIISKKKAILIKIISILIIGILAVASADVLKAHSALEQISSIDVKLDNMIVIVPNTDSAENIVDAADYTFAVEISEGEIGEYASIMVDEIQENVGKNITVASYESLENQVQALMSGEVDAIIYNEAFKEMIEEETPGFNESTKVIFEHGIEVKIEKDEEVEKIEVEEEVYTVYISGIDVYGSIAKTSRSDVNILATINPNTEQILLVTTPRDYYVTIPGISGEKRDKLTHAGIYGVNASMDTIEALYGIDIDFYARVNFTSLVNMVDALGGISVYSNQAFTRVVRDGGKLYIQEGYNELNGQNALEFARERMHISGGDYQRGKNQEELIKAMIQKATSPAIITGAYEIVDSISENVDTNMTTKQIQDIIKKQIDEETQWDIVMMAAEAKGGRDTCYSSGSQSLFVAYPIQESVDKISKAIEAIYANEKL